MTGPETGTLLWQPDLTVTDGSAPLTFETGSRPAGYRILLLGHSADGRLGFYQGRIDVQAPDTGRDRQR